MPQVTPISPDTPLPTHRAALRPAQQAEFIERLARSGNVRDAAKACGISRATVYRLKRDDYRFEQLWKAALVMARDHAEQVLAERALNGVEEVVYYHGEEIATRRRYDARLLLAHLARLDRLAGDPYLQTALCDFEHTLKDLRAQG